MLKSIDTIVVFATTSNSVTISVTGIGLLVTPLKTGAACGLTISFNAKREIVKQR